MYVLYVWYIIFKTLFLIICLFLCKLVDSVRLDLFFIVETFLNYIEKYIEYSYQILYWFYANELMIERDVGTQLKYSKNI